MTITCPVPIHVPTEASIMTVGELADRYRELKPQRGFLRMSFKFLRFEPTGVLRSIQRTGPHAGQLVLLQGGLHPKTYEFTIDSPLADQSECWVWTPAMEKATVG